MTNLHFTANCRFDGLKPEALFAIIICHQVYQSFGVPMWLTSVNDSGHMPGSRHYKGLAFDIRVHNIPAQHRQAIPEQIKKRLSPVYDVLDEGDHIHVEYDPK